MNCSTPESQLLQRWEYVKQQVRLHVLNRMGIQETSDDTCINTFERE